jgi:RNA polymerase sigma-70 factor (ECF subfamily)
MEHPLNGQGLKISRVEEVFDDFRKAGKSDEEIFVTVYLELKQLARRMLSRERPGNSMHATRLLSDLWLRLFGKHAADFEWQSGAHFYHTMARGMRQLLIDHARRHRAQSADGGHLESLDQLLQGGVEAPTDSDKMRRNWFQEKTDQSLAIAQALSRLEQDNPRQADIIYLRVYAGLSEEESAGVLGVSSETITKEFRKAKARVAYYLSLETTP